MLRRLAAALHYRDFRVLWIGAFTSSIGTWMQRVAQSWLVLTITGSASAFYLGLDSFLGEAPILLFTLIGGVVADRRDRRQLLLMSQYVQMTAAFMLAALVYWDVVRIWHVLALSVVTGVGQAFGGPAYQSLIPLLVDKQHLPNAIALNSIQFNLARVIGPIVAGATLTAFGMVACFGLNGLSFLSVIAAILGLHVVHAPAPSTTTIRAQLKGGLEYVRSQPQLITLTIIGFVTAFLGFPVTTFLPVIVKDVFNQDVGLYTRLMTFAGAGAVLGALVVAWIGKHRHMGLMMLVLQGIFGVFVIAVSLSRRIALTQALLFIAWFLLVMCMSLTTSLVQLLAPAELRGRVVSIYMVAFRGGSPLGGLVAGWLVTQLGSAPTVLAVNGALLILTATIALTWIPSSSETASRTESNTAGRSRPRLRSRRIDEAHQAEEGEAAFGVLDLCVAPPCDREHTQGIAGEPLADGQDLRPCRVVELGLSGRCETPDARREHDLRRADDTLETSVKRLREQDPELASLVTAESPSIQEMLDIAKRSNAVVVEYMVTERALLAWTVSADGIHGDKLNVDPKRLEGQVADIRKLIDPLGTQPKKLDEHLRQLYTSLIAPIQRRLPKSPNVPLIIIPDGAVALVPFAALRDSGGVPLVSRYALATAPSISVYRYTPEKVRSAAAASVTS